MAFFDPTGAIQSAIDAGQAYVDDATGAVISTDGRVLSFDPTGSLQSAFDARAAQAASSPAAAPVRTQADIYRSAIFTPLSQARATMSQAFAAAPPPPVVRTAAPIRTTTPTATPWYKRPVVWALGLVAIAGGGYYAYRR